MAARKWQVLFAAGGFCLATCVPGTAIAGEAQYRWTNERGSEVYSDRPPPAGTDYEVVKSGTGLKRVVPGSEGAVPATVEPSVGNEFTQIDDGEAKRSKKNPELCERAKTDLETLSGDQKVQVRDKQGELRFLSDEERLVERAKTEAQVKVYCP